MFLLVFVVAKCLRKLFFLGGGLASINEASLVFLSLVVREFLKENLDINKPGSQACHIYIPFTTHSS